MPISFAVPARRRSLSSIIAYSFVKPALLLIALSEVSQAATLTWDGNAALAPNPNGGIGNWDVNSNLNWWDGTNNVVWPALGGTDDDAIFADTAGTVTLTSAITANDLTFNTTGYIVTGNTLTLNGSTPTITTGSGISATFSSIISGSSGLQKSGIGTLVLTGVNNYSGGTTVTDGTLTLGNGTINPTIGSGAYSVSNGATLRFRYNTAGVTGAPTFSSITGAGTLALATGKSFDFGWGTPALTAGFTGTLQIEGGRVAPAAVSSLGGTTAITILNGGQLGLYNIGNNTLAQNFTIAGTGYGEGGYESAIRLANGGQSTTLSGTIALSASATIAATGTSTITNVVSGGAGSNLTFGTSSQAGTIILTNANTYTGNTTIAFGTMQLGNGGATGSLTTVGTITNNGTLSINRNNAVAQGTDFSGAAITGTGGFTQAGTGTTTLNAANTFSGNTAVNAGLLNLSNSLALQNSTVTTGGTGIIFDSSVVSNAFTLGGLTGSTNLALVNNAGSPSDIALTVGKNNGNATYTGNLSGGAGSLTKIGTGSQTLSGVNTYTGGTTLTGGTLQFVKLTSMPATGTIAVGTGTTLAVNVGGTDEWTTGTSGGGTVGGLLAGLGGQGSSTVTYTGAVALGLDTTNATSTQTYSGTIANVGTTLGITKLGTGTLALTAVNTFTGPTNVNGGTLSIGGSGTLNSGAFANNVTIASGATFDYASSANQTFSGTNSGAGALTMSGPGTLTLMNASTAGGAFLPLSNTGGTTVSGGTLKLDMTARSNDTGFSIGTIHVAAGGTLELFANKTVSFGTQDALISNGTVITGSGTINKTGTGVADLWYSGSGTTPSIKNFTGQINIQAGVLSNQTGADWSTSAGLMSVDISPGAFFDLRTDNAVINKLTGSGTVANSHSSALGLTVGGGNGNATFSGLIRNGGAFPGGANSGSLFLTKIGSGTQTLNGSVSNTYTGATTVRGGTLLLDFANLATPTNLLAAATPLTLGGGTLSILGKNNGTTTQSVASLSLTTLTNSNIVLTPNGGTNTTLTITNNTLTTGAGAQVNFNLSAGTTNATTSTLGDTIVAWNPALTSGIIGSGYTVTDTGGSGFATIASGKVVRLADTGTAGLPQTGGVSTTNYFINQNYSTISTTTDGSLVEALSGAVVANTVSVDTTGLASGANLALGSNSLTLNTGMVFSGANPYAVTASGGSLQGISGGALTFQNYASDLVTISAPILANGSNALTFAGTGTTVLSGANTYTGGTTIASGSLRVGGATALGANASAVTVRSGAALDLNGTTMTGTNALTLNGTGVSGGGALTNNSGTAGTYAGLVTLGSNSTIFANNGNITLSNTGTITGAGLGLTLDGSASGTIASIIGTGTGTLVKQGTGMWTLNGANTFSGGTTITAGTLRIDLTARTGQINPLGTYNIGSNGTLTLLNANTTIDNVLILNTSFTGTGTLAKTGAGYIGLWTGTSFTNFAGTIDVQGGTLGFNNLGTGATSGLMSLNIASGATFDLRHNSAITIDKLTGFGVVANSFSVGTLSIGNNNGTSSFSGVIQNGVGLSLTKNGTGTQTLSGANTYVGATTVNGGTLTVSVVTSGSNNANVGGNQFASSAITVASGAIFNFGTGGNFSSANGGTMVSGAGTVRLSSGKWFLGNGGGGTTISMAAGGLIDVRPGATLSGDYSNANWTANQGNLNVDGSYDLRNNNSTVGALTGAGAIFDNGFTNTLTVGAGNATGGIFNGTIGVGGVTVSISKTGTGIQALTGANTYTGTTTVSGGTLSLANTAGYKTTSLPVASGATLLINATGNATSAGANAAGSWAPFNSVVASVTGAGVVALNGTQFVNGSVSTGGFKTNLSAGGVIDVQGGSWSWGFSRGVAATNLGSLNIVSGAEWRSSDAAFQFDALTGVGTIGNAYNTPVTLTLGVSNTTNNAIYGVASNTATFNGIIKSGDTYTGVTTSSLSLVKTGTGTQILTGANTYTGGTTVNAGTLLANNTTGSALGTANVIVNGGTLGGTGSFTGGVTLNNTSTLAPGASIESLAMGALTFNSGSTYAYELDTTALNGDFTKVNGNLSIDAAANLLLTDLDADTVAIGSKLTLINYSGTWNTTAFAGYADDSTFLLGSNSWLINYNDITGGSNFTSDIITPGASSFVTLTAVVVPEPSTLVLGGITLLGFAGVSLRRRRQRA